MAERSSSYNVDATQLLTPGAEVLSSLARRLRAHVKGMANAQAKRTMGADMLAAAHVVEQIALGMSPDIAADMAMIALLGRDGAASYKGGRHS